MRKVLIAAALAMTACAQNPPPASSLYSAGRTVTASLETGPVYLFESTSDNAERVDSLAPGQKATIVSAGAQWALVSTESGKRGWALVELLRPSNATTNSEGDAGGTKAASRGDDIARGLLDGQIEGSKTDAVLTGLAAAAAPALVAVINRPEEMEQSDVAAHAGIAALAGVAGAGIVYFQKVKLPKHLEASLAGESEEYAKAFRSAYSDRVRSRNAMASLIGGAVGVGVAWAIYSSYVEEDGPRYLSLFNVRF